MFENTASNLLGTISASQIGGTIPLAQLPPGIITNGASGVNITGTFSGNGAGVTNVNLVLNSGSAILSGGFMLAASPGVGSFPVSVCTADVNGMARWI
jgi:hypothetical protein